MKKAKELMLDFTALAFRDPQRAADMFTEDGAFEMHYLGPIGYPSRYKGREEIADFFQLVREVYPYFEFEYVQVLVDTPEQVFAEYKFAAMSTITGRQVQQLFFGRLVAENGKIKLLNSFDASSATIH
jgi:uncharacterized protein